MYFLLSENTKQTVIGLVDDKIYFHVFFYNPEFTKVESYRTKNGGGRYSEIELNSNENISTLLNILSNYSISEKYN